MLQEMPIKSGLGDYKVHFFDDPVKSVDLLNSQKPTHFIADRNVYELHKSSIDFLKGDNPLFLIDATEETKTLDGVHAFATWLQNHNANRSSVVVALGGGITQDLAAFTAHNYYRGIPWIFFPTTLLAMCDSSIGAKCGVNLNEFKNQLGCFQAPKVIFTCSDFLKTLPDFHVSSGYGEILKLYLTSKNWGLLDELESALAQGLRNPSLLSIVRTSLEIKRSIIEVDEFEKDLRRILNYGHTFGHALESMTNHEIPHGLAVAWGMDLINWMAVQRGLLAEPKYQRIRSLIKKHFPYKFKQKISAEALINGARKDKKTDQTGINLIFLNDGCFLEIRKVPFDDLLRGHIERYVNTENIYL